MKTKDMPKLTKDQVQELINHEKGGEFPKLVEDSEFKFEDVEYYGVGHLNYKCKVFILSDKEGKQYHAIVHSLDDGDHFRGDMVCWPAEVVRDED